MEKYLGTGCSAVSARHCHPAHSFQSGQGVNLQVQPCLLRACVGKHCAVLWSPWSGPEVGVSASLVMPAKPLFTWLPDMLKGNIIVLSVKYWGSTEEYFPSAREKKSLWVPASLLRQRGVIQGARFPRVQTSLRNTLEATLIIPGAGAALCHVCAGRVRIAWAGHRGDAKQLLCYIHPFLYSTFFFTLMEQ